MVEAKVQEDMSDVMQCINHPFTKNPGGICPLCLQEKLGKLVTSSFPLPNHLSSSSSTSSPSFRSDSVRSSTVSAANLSLSVAGASNNVTDINNKNKLPFLLANKKKKMANIVYKRSQSTTAYGGSDLTPRKRNGFWSFLHIHSYKQHSSKKLGNFQTKHAENTLSETETRTVGSSERVNRGGSVIVEEDAVTATTVRESERRVSRSRSVGCGSRSFSGEFFERITHGFGDCTLRRVESQREGNNNNNNKGKVSSDSSNVCVREQIVRCGGIFSGFMIMTPSSSSSSSSSSAEQHHHQNMAYGGRNRSWGWAFASPMRAFGSSSGKRGRTISDSTSKNTTPNLDAIPSLLAV